jgi:hypothetical protein
VINRGVARHAAFLTYGVGCDACLHLELGLLPCQRTQKRSVSVTLLRPQLQHSDNRGRAPRRPAWPWPSPGRVRQTPFRAVERNRSGSETLGWSCHGASDHGPVSFRRVGQSVDLPVKARRWGHDLRGSPHGGCLKSRSRPAPPPRGSPPSHGRPPTGRWPGAGSVGPASACASGSGGMRTGSGR